MINRIFNAYDRAHAEDRLKDSVQTYEETQPKLAAWAEENIPVGFTVFSLPESHRKRMRTSTKSLWLSRSNVFTRHKAGAKRPFTNTTTWTVKANMTSPNKLDADDKVILFTKLKKGGFVIDTPHGDYSPDWAIVYKTDDDHLKIYFIVETKADKDWDYLTQVEKDKIKCGGLHFKAVSDEIKFDWVNSYKDFRKKFQA